MALINFNAQTVSPESEFTPLPAGIYTAQVTDSEVKPTKTGTGHYLQLTWRVLEGPQTGRMVFDRLNIANANETATKIGQQMLSQLCHAIGVLQVADSSQLHNRPCRIKVVIRKDDQYGDSNEVKGYEAVSGGSVPSMPAFVAPQPAKPAPQTFGANGGPWSQRAA